MTGPRSQLVVEPELKSGTRLVCFPLSHNPSEPSQKEDQILSDLLSAGGGVECFGLSLEGHTAALGPLWDPSSIRKTIALAR